MTDAFKGTPGPWTIEEYGDEDAPTLVIHKDSETRVCFMATPGSMGDPAKIEADAHLIITAHDYHTNAHELEHLSRAIERAMRDSPTTIPGDLHDLLRLLAANRVAIAKAEGRA